MLALLHCPVSILPEDTAWPFTCYHVLERLTVLDGMTDGAFDLAASINDRFRCLDVIPGLHLLVRFQEAHHAPHARAALDVALDHAPNGHALRFVTRVRFNAVGLHLAEDVNAPVV